MKTDKRKYKDRAAYLKRKVAERRKTLKILAIKAKGGRCYFCGYSKCIDALEFHHLDEDIKEFGLSSRGLTRSWAKVQKELEKCILVCANCHREIHAGLLQPLTEMSESKVLENLKRKGGEFREAHIG
jgi:hypothetical protein